MGIVITNISWDGVSKFQSGDGEVAYMPNQDCQHTAKLA